jgi:hypothetical protein
MDTKDEALSMVYGLYATETGGNWWCQKSTINCMLFSHSIHFLHSATARRCPRAMPGRRSHWWGRRDRRAASGIAREILPKRAAPAGSPFPPWSGCRLMGCTLIVKTITEFAKNRFTTQCGAATLR